MATAKDTEDFKKVIEWWIRKNILIALCSAGLFGAVLFDCTAAALWKSLGTHIEWFPTTRFLLVFIQHIDATITTFVEERRVEAEHE